MSTLSTLLMTMALSLSGAATEMPAETALEPAPASIAIELDDRSTLADSILGEDREMADFVRRLV